MHLAVLTGNYPRAGNDTMAKQHGRLLDVFRDSEGRDPSPDGDPQFWEAWNVIAKAATGEEPATVPGGAPDDFEWRPWEPNEQGEYDTTGLSTEETLRKAIRAVHDLT
jgi:hypothetical protein